jgi:hypothetical protein
MARDNSTGCSAESQGCDGGAGWGPGMGGGGAPGPPDAGPGTSGGGGRGGGAGVGRPPGTGCDPGSSDFRDVDNWRDARRAVAVFRICEASGGTARMIPRPPAPDPDGGSPQEGWRVAGVGCLLDGVEDIYVFPTTMECYNAAW